MRLEWTPTSAPGLLGYQLFRKLAADTAYIAITGTIPSATSRIGDFQLANGIEHDYRLYYVFDRGRGTLYAQDIATPGNLEPWIADPASLSLVRLAADGRRVDYAIPFATGASGFGAPLDVAADPANGVLWVSTESSALVRYLPSNDAGTPLSPPDEPGAIALDPVNGNVWVCDGSPRSTVEHFTTGGMVASPGNLGLMENPLDIAVDPGNRSVWVCERDGNRVTHVAADGSGRIAATLLAPSRVAVDSLTHEAWATSSTRGRVYRISGSAAISDSFAFAFAPVGVAVDARRGRIWVADPGGDQLFALHRDGSVEFQLPGLGAPRELALDLATGDAWVTLATSRQVARVSAAGKVLTLVGGFSQPAGISIGVAP